VVTICTASLTFITTFCPHTAFTCSVHNIDWPAVKRSLRIKRKDPLHHVSPTRGLPTCIVRPAAVFVSCAYTINITQRVRGTTFCQLSTFGLPTSAQYRCGPVPYKGRRRLSFTETTPARPSILRFFFPNVIIIIIIIIIIIFIIIYCNLVVTRWQWLFYM